MEGKGGAGAFRTRAVRIPEGIPTYSEVPSIARGRHYAGSERKTARLRGGDQGAEVGGRWACHAEAVVRNAAETF